MAVGKQKRKSRQPRLDDKLSPLKQRFVEEYLIDCNATQAAIRAGYSERTARSKGSALLTEPAVQAAISAAMAARSRKVGITAERVLEEIALVAFADIGEVIRVDEHGMVYVRQLENLRPEARRAISEIKQTSTEHWDQEEERTVEKIQLGVKLNPKVNALKLLVDHLGLNAPVKHDHSVEMKSARERLAARLDELASRKPSACG